MSTFTTQKCDICNRTKTESNNWFLLDTSFPEEFKLRRWNDDIATQSKYEHLCSESCVVKALNKFLARPA
jgi:hypothetical protein